MNSFICLALIVIVINCVCASPANNNAGTVSSVSSGSSSGVSAGAQEAEAEVSAVNQGLLDISRFRKAAFGTAAAGGYGGGASMQAPPCPKNYLFSCQPNLAPVPCSAPNAGGYGSAGGYAAPAAGFGSAGAYSSPVAAYVNPNYGVPQQQQLFAANAAAYLPQAYATYQY